MIARPFTYHVMPVGGAWKVRAPGDLQPTSIHSTLSDAIDRAEKLAREHLHGDIVIHEAGRTFAPPARAVGDGRRAG